MAVPIAATARTTDTVPTRRSAPVDLGKPSRVMPRNATITAQTANSPPHTWKAFTARTLAKRLAASRRSQRTPDAPGRVGSATPAWGGRYATCGAWRVRARAVEGPDRRVARGAAGV